VIHHIKKRRHGFADFPLSIGHALLIHFAPRHDVGRIEWLILDPAVNGLLGYASLRRRIFDARSRKQRGDGFFLFRGNFSHTTNLYSHSLTFRRHLAPASPLHTTPASPITPTRNLARLASSRPSKSALSSLNSASHSVNPHSEQIYRARF